MINIVVLYPELLNMFGDSGNILCLKKRLMWRDIEVKITEISLDSTVDLKDADIVYIGGGGEAETLIALKKLSDYKEALKGYVEDGGVLLSVCSGYELLGKSLELKGEKREGLGILDITSTQSKKRISSDIVIESEFGLIAGFENHLGRMNIGSYSPLGRVKYGSGNNGTDGSEGLIYKNTFATYMDGPVLPKNPKLCDEIIKRALLNKGESTDLKELDDAIELTAQKYILNKYSI